MQRFKRYVNVKKYAFLLFSTLQDAMMGPRKKFHGTPTSISTYLYFCISKNTHIWWSYKPHRNFTSWMLFPSHHVEKLFKWLSRNIVAMVSGKPLHVALWRCKVNLLFTEWKISICYHSSSSACLWKTFAKPIKIGTFIY